MRFKGRRRTSGYALGLALDVETVHAPVSLSPNRI